MKRMEESGQIQIIVFLTCLGVQDVGIGVGIIEYDSV